MASDLVDVQEKDIYQDIELMIHGLDGYDTDGFKKMRLFVSDLTCISFKMVEIL